MISVKNGYKAGDAVKITVFRAGEYLTLTMTFDEQQAQQGGMEQNPVPQETPSQSGSYFDPWSFFFGNGW